MESRKLPKYLWIEVTGDLLTNFCEVVFISNLRSATVIEKVKGNFARRGTPETFH